MASETMRCVRSENREIAYLLEQKPVKNLNLRIHKDGRVFLSANPDIPTSETDAFILSKASYIFAAQDKFAEIARYSPQPKQYVSGETFYFLGRSLRLKVASAAKETVYTDGVYLFLNVKDITDFSKKQRLVTRFLDRQCEAIFREVLDQTYPPFQKYSVAKPQLRIRAMETRWGSCLPKKQIITLNKQLLEAPRDCIEYVVVHELCHLVHPNHSKQFYAFLTMFMPDWKERKTELEKSCILWL